MKLSEENKDKAEGKIFHRRSPEASGKDLN
jgi:hypothetical protein